MYPFPHQESWQASLRAVSAGPIPHDSQRQRRTSYCRGNWCHQISRHRHARDSYTGCGKYLFFFWKWGVGVLWKLSFDPVKTLLCKKFYYPLKKHVSAWVPRVPKLRRWSGSSNKGRRSQIPRLSAGGRARLPGEGNGKRHGRGCEDLISIWSRLGYGASWERGEGYLVLLD